MKKIIKKLWVILIIQTLLIVFIPLNSKAAIDVTSTKNRRGVTITVRSDDSITSVRVYVKNDVGEWQQFYTNSETDYNQKAFFFPYSRLRTKDKDNIKVKVDTENGDTHDVVVTPGTDDGETPGDDQNDDDNDDNDDNDDDDDDDNDDNDEDDEDNQDDEENDENDEEDVEIPTEDEGIAINSELVLDMPSKTSQQLTVKLPNGVSKDHLTWKTSNTNVAKVDAFGTVSAVCPGSCKITVTRGEKTAECTVKVKFRGKEIANGKKVYFLDTQKTTAQGAEKGSFKHNDAILIESEGKYGLIDTSIKSMGVRIVQYLKDLQVDELEWVLITHFDGDHYGGFEKIINNVKIKTVYMKKIESATGYKTVSNAVSKHPGTKISYVTEKTKEIKLADTTFNLYNTDLNPGTIKKVAKYDKFSDAAIKRQNMYSIVAVANMNNKKVLFMGDFSSESNDYTKAETAALQKICNNVAKSIGKVDVYKAAHHGLNGNRKTEVNNNYKPDYAVITNVSATKNKNATEDPAANIKKCVNDKLYCTGKGTRVFSINSKGDIHVKKLDNDDADSSSKKVTFTTGTAKVYAYSKSKRHTANLSKSIEAGKTDKMNWNSENPKVATVDSNGKVTAVAPGETKITVVNGNNAKGEIKLIVLGLVKNSSDSFDMDNNTKYLQELIDNASKEAGKNGKQQTVTIGEGQYNFSADDKKSYIIKCKNNVLIEGKGQDKTILKPYGATESGLNMFYYNNYIEAQSSGSSIKPDPTNGYYLVNADFKNFTVDGIDTSTKNYSGSGKAFMINVFKDCDWDSVTAKYTDGSGFGVTCPKNVTMKNCYAYNCGKAATTSQGGASGFGIGTGYAEGESIVISNCKAELNKRYGFFFEHQSKYYNENNQLYNSYDAGNFKVDNCTASGNLYDFGGNRAHDVTYTSCKSKKYAKYPSGRSKNSSAFHFKNYSVRCKVENCTVEGEFTDIADKSETVTKAINWGIKNGIVEGRGNWEFGDVDMDRGMAIELIWRAQGRPGEIVQNKNWNELKTRQNGKEVNLESGFSDVKLSEDTKYYFLAIKWGKENGVVSGKGNGVYDDTSVCTRAQFVVMLWKLSGSPSSNYNTKFTDLKDDWYIDAVKWAEEKGITVGTSQNTFSPDDPCTKSQAMTMLYRMYGK